MRKILLLLCLAYLFTCKNETKEAPEMEPPINTKNPIVYVSNFPLKYLAERIGGDKIDVHFPMENSESISNWKPETDTIANMQEADFVFINGASFEKWLMSISLPESILINTSKPFEGDLLDSGKVFTHSHGNDGAHEHNEIASTTWLDLSLANKQADVIAKHLITKFPENETYYQANFEKLSNDLLTLDAQFKKLTNENPDISVVFSHPVYQYFSKAYNLKGRSLHWEPDYELNPDREHEIEHLKKEKDFKMLIWEDTPLQKTNEALLKLQIESVVINPIFKLSNPQNYLEIMQQNYKNLQQVYASLN